MADAGEIKAKVIITYDGSGVDKAKRDLEELGALGGTVEAGANKASDGLAGLEDQTKQTAASTEGLNTALEKTSKPTEALTTAVSEVNDRLADTQTIAEDTGQAFQALHEPIQKTTALIGDTSTAIPLLSKQAESLHSALGNAGGGFAQVQSVMEETMPMLQPYTEHMQRLQQMASFFSDHPLLPAPTPEAMQAIEEMPNVVEGTIQAINDVVDSAPTWREQFGFGSDFQLQFAKDGSIIGAGAEQIQNHFAQMDAAANTAQESFSNFTETSQVAGQTLDANVTPSLSEAGKATENFNTQFSNLNDSVAETNKTMKETGAGGLFGGAGASEDVVSPFMGFLNDVMMPLMAVQMVGSAISAVGKNIYDAAAIAEGPGAHGLGTFTGAVDTFRASTEKANQSFSEGFGQGVLPSLEGMNNANANGDGGIDWGKFGYGLGTEGGIFGDLLGLAGGGMLSGLAKIVTLNPENTFGDNIWKGSAQGLANTWAGLTGQELPYPGPAGPNQVQIAYQQQMAAMPAQLAIQTATLNAQSNDPEFLAAQAGYQSAYGKAVKAQQSYDVSHYAGTSGPTDWQNEILQYQAVTAAGGTYGDLTDPNAQFFGWNDYINGKNGPPPGSYNGLNYSNSGGNSGGGATTGSGGGGGMGGMFGGFNDWFKGAFGEGGSGGSVGAWFNSLFSGDGGASVPATTFTGGCFVAGTPISLANGTTRSIEALQVGDKVLACDGIDEVVTTVLARCTPLPKRVYKLTFDDGRTLTLTDSHPLAGVDGWKSLSPEATAQENPGLEVSILAIGDVIRAVDGEVKLTSILPLQGLRQIYNIEVGDPHTFYAAGILVHNKTASASIGQQASEQIGDIQLPHMNLSGMAGQLGGAFSGISLPHIDLSGMSTGLGGAFSGISLPHMDLSGMASGLGGAFSGISLPHMDLSGMAAGLGGAFSGISLPHIDMSGITGSLAGAFSGITMPPIPAIGSEISGALGGMFSGITMPPIPAIGSEISGALGGMFSGISMPAIPDIGSSISGALSGMFGGISVPSPPQVGGMISGAMSGLFGGISVPTPPEVGAMISGAMGGIFSGITVPSPPNVGAMISGAMSSMFSGISMPSIPFFADGVSNFSGGAAVVGEAGTEVAEYNGHYALFDQGAAFVNLPSGASVYTMKDMAAYSSPHMMANGTGEDMAPRMLGASGGASFVINITHITQLDGRTIMKESTQHLATAARQLTGGKR